MPGEDFILKYSEPMEFERSDSMEEERADAAPSAGELLTLHGRSVLDYAALCTEPSRGAAERLAGQAFRNIYDDAASHLKRRLPVAAPAARGGPCGRAGVERGRQAFVPPSGPAGRPDR